ncbi:MAG TPA: FAD-linked oxidase C-terminal domain-containing protein, partial [Streptosporangiaceae bacterium]
GGKVVKNVAGYDLCKLYAGSYGTLGLITDATFRLHPAPAAAALVTIDCADPEAAALAVETMAGSPLAPSAIELDWPSASGPIDVSVLLEGDEDSVAGRADRMLSLLGERAMADPRSAQRERADHRRGRPSLSASDAETTVLQIGFWAGQLAAVLMAIRTAALAEDLDPAIGGSAAAGVLHIDVDGDAPADAVLRFVAALRAGLAGRSAGSVPPAAASVVVQRAPAAVRDAVDVWGAVPSLGLMRAIKDQFDPDGRLAPGRLAGGI